MVVSLLSRLETAKSVRIMDYLGKKGRAIAYIAPDASRSEAIKKDGGWVSAKHSAYGLIDRS